MPAAVMAAAFQDIQETHEIGLNVGVGILKRVADSRLGRHVKDTLRAHGLKQLRRRPPVRQLKAVKVKACESSKPLQPGFLQPNIVIIVQVIESHDFVASGQQFQGKVEADKSGGAGEEQH